MLNANLTPPEGMITEFGINDLPHSAFKGVYQYWLDMREDKPFPDTNKLDPLELPRKALPYIAICGVEGEPPEFPLRLTGSHVVEETGADNTNKRISEVHGMEEIQKRLTWTALTGQKYLTHKRVTWTDKDYKQYDVLVLPFGTGGKVNKILMLMHVYIAPNN